MTEKLNEDFLIEEYSKCWENLHHLDNLFWKIPTIAITIVSFVYGALFFNIEKLPIDSVALIICVFTITTCFFLFILVIDLVKIRKYTKLRFEFLREIEKKILNEGNEKLKLATYGDTKRNKLWYMKHLSILIAISLISG
jgi:hypothetical protein